MVGRKQWKVEELCSFVRVESPQGLEPPKELGTSLEPGTAFPLKRNALGGMRASERKSPLSMEVGFTHEGKDDLGERSVFMGTQSPMELEPRVRLGERSPPWGERLLVSNKSEERMASPETKSLLSKELEMRLKAQNISRTCMEGSNLGVNRGSSSQETKPSLSMLPGRVGLENECLLAGCSGKIIRPPLGMVCESPQALGSRRGPVAGAPERLGASVEKQPFVGVEPKQKLEKESTCVVMKPSAEMNPPVQVDIGLPQAEEPDEMKDTEPQMGLVIEPPEYQFAQQPKEEKKDENIEPGVEPPDRIRPIYSGQFFDRMPCWPSVSFFLILSLGTSMYSQVFLEIIN